MKKKILFTTLLLTIVFVTGCGSSAYTEGSTYTATDIEYSPTMLPEEQESITIGELSPEHEFYNDAIEADAKCPDYIKEIAIYDKEVDDNFVIHISLPPDYDSTQKYPMVVMTDGIWRLQEHIRFRSAMLSGELDKLIMVSIGYPNGYDYQVIRNRDFFDEPESYLHFIVDNLIPYLKENYSVDEENLMLSGHSYGGFFAFQTLFYNDTITKHTFKNYFIGSTAFPDYERREKFFFMEAEYYEKTKELDCNVYMAVSDNEGSFFTDIDDELLNLLNERSYEKLNLTHEVMEGYVHEKSFEPAFINSIYVFYGN